MATELIELAIHEGSVVDQPANKAARVLLFKQEAQADTPAEPLPVKSSLLVKILSLFGKLGAKTEDLDALAKDMGVEPAAQTLDEAMDGQSSLDQLTHAMETFFMTKAGKKISDARMQKLREMPALLSQIMGEQDPEVEKTDSTDKENDMAETQPTPPAEEMIAKAVESAIAKVREETAKEIAAVTKRADEAEALAKSERDARETHEFTKRVETEWSHLDGEVEKKVSVMKAIAQLPTETAEVIRHMLKTADARVKAGRLFAAAGVDGVPAGGGTATDALRSLAKAMVAKGEASSEIIAIGKIAQAQPALYAQYVKEGN